MHKADFYFHKIFREKEILRKLRMYIAHNHLEFQNIDSGPRWHSLEPVM